MAQGAPKKRLLLVFLLAFAVCLPSIFWNTLPLRDSSLYALLTLEFSQGNFHSAFNADFSPLLTSLGGMINYLLNDPFLANKLASCLLFLIGIPATYKLVEELKGAEVAYIASLLYAVCPYTVELATSGGVDSGKLGLLPWLVWLTLRWCDSFKIRWGLLVGFVGGVLSYARGEGIFFAILSLILFFLYSCWNHFRKQQFSLSKVIFSAFSALCLLLIVTYPLIIYQKGQTGYLVTHPSQIRIYNLLDNIKESPRPEAKATTVEGSKEEIRHTEKMQPTETVSITRDIDWAKNTAKTVKGFYIPFLLLALLVIVYPSPFRASLTRKDIFPLIYITLNIAMFFPTNVCNSRYFQTVIPLYLHLAALGVLVVGNILTRYSITEKQLKILAYLGLLVLALLAQKECDFLKSDAKMREDQTLMEIGHWIAKNRNFFPSYGQLVNGREYHNGRLPVILSVDYRIAYYASSDCVILPKDGHVTPEKMADFCLQNKVSLILYDRKMEEFCPGFGKYWPTEPDFKPVEIMGSSPPYAEGVRLLAFDPDVMKNAPPLPKIN